MQDFDMTCQCCAGTHTQEVKHHGEDWKTEPCMHEGTAAQIWEETEYLLRQFIQCSADRETGSCAGCEYERQDILSLMWHYRQAEE